MTDNSSASHQLNDSHSQDDEGGDPAEAFEALRGTVEELAEDLVREMTVIRKGVEAALDGQEKFQQPVDYGGHLAQIAENQALMVEHLKALAKSPILKNGPEHYARVIERGGESLVRTAAQQFQSESRDFQRMTREMAEHIRGAWDRRLQNRWFAGIGVGGVIFAFC